MFSRLFARIESLKLLEKEKDDNKNCLFFVCRRFDTSMRTLESHEQSMSRILDTIKALDAR